MKPANGNSQLSELDIRAELESAMAQVVKYLHLYITLGIKETNQIIFSLNKY